MRYLGSKDSLAGQIMDLLRNKGLLQSELIFCDGFCGMGSVADSVKNIYKQIIINDSLKCAAVFTHARLIANGCTFKKLGFDPFNFLNTDKGFKEGFIYQNYSPGASERMYFSKENAGRIDFFREKIEEWYETEKITDNEYSYLLACLLESVSDISNTAGVYGAFLKHWDKRALKPIVFNKIDASPGIAADVKVLNSKIEDIISEVDCDILYLDPPYTQNQYGTQYHLLETLVLNDNPTISKVTGSRPTTPMRSQWSKNYYAHVLFDKIIAETKAKYIIFSYNNDGFMSKDFIETTMKRYGIEDSYVCEVIDYKKYNNFKCQGANGHFEYLFFIEKKPTDRVVIESPLNYTGSKSKMVGFIKSQLPQKGIDTFVDAFGGGFNVGINIDAKKIIYNDINPFVEGLIRSFYTDPCSYLQYIERQIKKYNLSPDNKDGFLELREKYNSIPVAKRDPRMLYTLILYGFQQQIRFNTNWGFNNPAGSRWFNENLLSKFIAFTRSLQTKNVEFMNSNFEFLDIQLTPQTFIYADPPYRSTLGVYNDGKRGFEGWTLAHERKLCKFLDTVNEHEAKFMLSYVVEVGEFTNTEIIEWTNKNKYHMVDVATTQGRYNNRHEVLIKNY